MVASCCRFLCYFCRISRHNQRSLFDHLTYLLENSSVGLGDSPPKPLLTRVCVCICKVRWLLHWILIGQAFNNWLHFYLQASPSMRGATPLDVAAASVMDNNELALALREPQLEKVNQQPLLTHCTPRLKTVTVLKLPFWLGQSNYQPFIMSTVTKIATCVTPFRWLNTSPAVVWRAVLCCWLKATLTLDGTLWRVNVT